MPEVQHPLRLGLEFLGMVVEVGHKVTASAERGQHVVHAPYVRGADYEALFSGSFPQFPCSIEGELPPGVVRIVVQSLDFLPAQGLRELEPDRVPPQFRIPF
ncbi:MAG: hypothetical protein DRP95_01920 [Candidatus Latescibacterota bacterium]|nr:MAG: hypothetical protein DRP95_01920 [Candidatus Latescibacterota bacterium]